jgi:Tol biopolymer transport system component
VWVLPLAGDRTPRPYLHTTFSEADPQFSPDGSLVAYSSDESGRNEIYLQPFSQPGAKVQVSTDGGESPRWAMAGNALYFLSSERRLMSASIQLRPLNIGAPVPLFDTSVGLGTNRYVPSRDGQHFLLSLGTARVDAAPLMVMLNWTASLHREAAESRVPPEGIEGNPQEGSSREGTGPPSSR